MQHQRLLPSRKKKKSQIPPHRVYHLPSLHIPHPSSPIPFKCSSLSLPPQKCGLASNPSGALFQLTPLDTHLWRRASNSPRQIRPIPLGPPRLQQRRHKRQREARHQVRRHEGGFEAVAGVAREAGGVVAEVGEHLWWLVGWLCVCWWGGKVEGRSRVLIYVDREREDVCVES